MVLLDPTITEKTNQLTLLQRQKPTVRKDESSTVSKAAEDPLNFVVFQKGLEIIINVETRTVKKSQL